MSEQRTVDETYRMLAFEQRKTIRALEHEYDQRFIGPILEIAKTLGLTETPQMEKVRDEYRFSIPRSEEKSRALTVLYLDMADQLADEDPGPDGKLASAILSIALYYPLSIEEFSEGFEQTCENAIEIAQNNDRDDIVQRLEELL